MEQFHVNAAKYSPLICRDSLCSIVLILKNTLITLLSHTLTSASSFSAELNAVVLESGQTHRDIQEMWAVVQKRQTKMASSKKIIKVKVN